VKQKKMLLCEGEKKKRRKEEEKCQSQDKVVYRLLCPSAPGSWLGQGQLIEF
jgi:hypothetical protein